MDKIDRRYYADNVAITAGLGTSVATDDIGGVQYQRIKLIEGADGTNDGDISSANGLPVELLASTAAIGKLAANSGVDIGDVTLTAGSASIGILGANSGVDIGDVTINNASGASAVNIQDGGNSITIDGTVTISDGSNSVVVLTDGADNVSNANNQLVVAGMTYAFDGTTWDRVTIGGGVEATAMRVTIASDSTGVLSVDDNGGALTVDGTVSLGAGSASIGILGANSGVDIGDVTINNASGGSAVNIQDGGNTITVDNGGTFATQDSQVVADNGAFTDGTTKVFVGGYIFDETAGTALTENDAAAARIDSKRAQVHVIEDATTRGRRAVIDYQGRMPVMPAADGVTISGNVFLEPQRQPINVSSNGQILISGIANRKLRVLNGLLMAVTAVTVNIKSNNNTDASGPLNLGATGGFQIPHAELGNFESRVGENLTISMNTGVQVGGWLTYVIV